MIMQRAIIVCTLGLSLSSNAFAATPKIDDLAKKSRDLASRTEAEAQKANTRWNHARELVGKNYHKSVVKTGEEVAELDQFLLNWTERALNKKWKRYSKKVWKTILEESDKYSFDPIFLMAVIENESSFNPVAVGTSGEVGLMQLTAETAEWISKKYGLEWKGKKSLTDPVINIRIGSAYLAYLRERFDFHSQLYLAAYNMGTTNVMRALEKQIWPKDYSTRVMQRYKRFYTQLKQEISKTIN
jgi:soluble lytic murein transglycosylase